MAKYLLVETKSPLEGGDYAFDLGSQLHELKHDVTIYLLQDAVFAARRNFRAGAALLERAADGGVHVLADSVSARQRGVVGDRVAEGVRVSDMGDMVDFLMEQADKAIWH